MKKSVLFLIAIAILFLFPLISADVNTTQINSGFTCLNQQVGDCSSLSLNEQIFTSLATGKCTNLIAGSSNNGCWPSSSCDIKTTAQAMLALSNSGLSTSNSEAWLATKQVTTSDIVWYLQVNTNSNSTCSVSYSGSSYTFSINQDKSLTSGAGSCLPLSSNGYWLSVSSSCYGTPFTISCNQPFTTTNLYQRQGYPTLYVSRASNSASAGSKISDTLNASCFGSSGSCNYEATLWAALALDSINKDVSAYLPYLTVMADDDSNQAYLPYAFLYSLTSSSDYLNTLLSQQKTTNEQNYWDAGSSYGSNYDTALALLPLQSQSPPEKTSAINWLMGVQKPTGCWDTLLNTAFILYSISGSQAKKTTTTDCASSGGYCISGVNCNQVNGNVMQGYSCSGAYICCSKNLVTPTCSGQGGQTCSSGQSCQGNPTSASDVTSGTCCIGSCTNSVLAQSDCELYPGVCRSSCYNNEQSISSSCALASESCCIQKQQNLSDNLWIFILIPLMLLILIGVLFRKKLRVFWFRVKLKFRKGPSNGRFPPSGLPPRPPFPPRSQPPMGFQRRPMPPRPIPNKQQQKSSEVNDVLKKLKEIGK